MAGKLPKTGSGRARPQRIRPHWWAVLAVSLSLLALVAAATSDHPAWHGNRGRDVTASKGPKAKLVPPTVPSTSTSTETTSPTQSVRALTQSGAAATVTRGATGEGVRPVTTPSTTLSTVPTTSTTAPTTPATTGPAPTAPAPQTRSGYLQQPNIASATYPFTGAGAMRVSVSWSPVDSLSLSVSCSGGTQSAEGTSSVAVVILDADGPCDLTLKELLVQFDAVSYTLTIAPASG